MNLRKLFALVVFGALGAGAIAWWGWSWWCLFQTWKWLDNQTAHAVSMAVGCIASLVMMALASYFAASD
ncbi:MAG: hypothetical protein AAGE52_01620, partial [Myxococcota bacterium]